MNFAPGADRDVEVRRRDDAAVDELAVAHLDRRVDHRQRRRGADGGRDRDVVPALGAEHDALARVEVRGGDVELGRELAEVVAAVGVRRARRAGSARCRRRCRRRTAARRRARARGPSPTIWPRCAATPREQLRGAQRQRDGAAREAGDVRPQEAAELEVRKRGRALAVDGAHHLRGRHAVGRHRADERAGARADVDVEVVDRPVDRQQVERAQGADLVDAAGEAAAAQHERRLRALAAPPALRPRPVLGLRAPA